MILRKGKRTAILKDGIGLMHSAFLKEDFGLLHLQYVSIEEIQAYKKKEKGTSARPVSFAITKATHNKTTFDFGTLADKTYEIIVDYYPHRKRG